MESVVRYASRRPMPAAVVADVATPSGLAAIRLLDRAGVPVLALDHRRGAVGFRSRLALSLHAPPPDDPRFVALLMELASALGRRAVLLPMSAPYLLPLAAARERLADGFHCAFPSLEAARAVAALSPRPNGHRKAVVACQLDSSGALLASFVARAEEPAAAPGDDELVAAAAGALRAAGATGPGWVELSPEAEVLAGGAYLWPDHAEAARRGINLPRVAYWTALGARLPLKGAGSGPWVGRAVALADPGPAVAAAASRFGRRG
jgi:hypothetical protein